MYSGIPEVGNNSKFFNFRELGGIQINKVTDIPYDFYTLVPTHLQPLYQEMRRERQWISGYVAGVHDRLLSSRICPTISNIITDKIIGDGYKYDGDDEQVMLLEKWDDMVGFRDTVELSTTNTNNLGWSFIKEDIINGQLTPSSVPADQCFFIFERNKLVDFKSVTTFIASNDLGETTFLMEHRYYDPQTGKPMIRHFFTQSNSQFSECASDLKNFSRGMNLNVPLLRRFGYDVQVGDNFIRRLEDNGIYIVPHELYFKSGLGVAIIKGSVQNPTYVKYPVGEGLVAQMGEDNVIKYEVAFSLASHELNIAPQTILVPQGFDNGNLNDPFRAVGGNIGLNNGVRKINGTYYVRVPFGDADGSNHEPKAVEFHIRANEIIDMKNNALRDCAINVGLQAKDVGLDREKAVYTSSAELGGKSDLSTNMVKRRRRLMNGMFKMIIDDVLDFYGVDGNATIMWTDMQVGDFATQVASYENAVKNFLMSPEEAMKRLYPNKTKREMVKLQEEVQRNRENIVNTYYGGVNENNTLKEKGDNNLESK